MKIINLLTKIESNNIQNGSMFTGGDLFYNLIVIDKRLYVINEITKEFILVDSHIIGDFIVKNYELYEYKKVID